MSIKKIEKGHYKVIARVWPNLKKEATVMGRLDDAKAKELELKKILLAKKADNEAASSLKYTTFGECLSLYNEERTWGDEIYNRLNDNLSHIRLPEIKDKLKTFVKKMSNSKCQNKNSLYSPATINRNIAMAKGAVSLAFKEDKIYKDYLSKFSLLKENNVKYRILDNSERSKLYNELANHLRPFFYFASRVPCRAGELVNLKREAYNPSRGLIILEDGTTKNGEGRWLPVFSEMKNYFDNIPQESDFLFYRIDNEGKYKPLGYWSEQKQRYIPNFKTAWNNACKRAGITGYNIHKCRQQSAMQLLYEGYREIEVMMIGGWKTFDAFRRYVKADDVMLQKKLGRWEENDSWKQSLAPITKAA